MSLSRSRLNIWSAAKQLRDEHEIDFVNVVIVDYHDNDRETTQILHQTRLSNSLSGRKHG